MKLTRRTMPEFYEALRTTLSSFDMELIGAPKQFLESCGPQHFDDIEDREITSGYQIRFTPFVNHKPFYRGQK